MEIVWSPQSLKDIEEIANYIAQEAPERARLFIDKLIISVDRLKEYPLSGQVAPESPIYRHLIFQTYRIIYRISVNIIQIVTVLAPGIDSTKRLKKK